MVRTMTLLMLLAGCGQVAMSESTNFQTEDPLDNLGLHTAAFATIIDGEVSGNSLNIADVRSFGNGQWRIIFKQPISEYSGLFVTANGNRTLITNAILWDKYQADVNVWRLDCTAAPCVPFPIEFPRFTLMVISLDFAGGYSQ